MPGQKIHEPLEVWKYYGLVWSRSRASHGFQIASCSLEIGLGYIQFFKNPDYPNIEVSLALNLDLRLCLPYENNRVRDFPNFILLLY